MRRGVRIVLESVEPVKPIRFGNINLTGSGLNRALRAWVGWGRLTL